MSSVIVEVSALAFSVSLRLAVVATVEKSGTEQTLRICQIASVTYEDLTVRFGARDVA